VSDRKTDMLKDTTMWGVSATPPPMGVPAGCKEKILVVRITATRQHNDCPFAAGVRLLDHSGKPLCPTQHIFSSTSESKDDRDVDVSVPVQTYHDVLASMHKLDYTNHIYKKNSVYSKSPEDVKSRRWWACSPAALLDKVTCVPTTKRIIVQRDSLFAAIALAHAKEKCGVDLKTLGDDPKRDQMALTTGPPTHFSAPEDVYIKLTAMAKSRIQEVETVDLTTIRVEFTPLVPQGWSSGEHCPHAIAESSEAAVARWLQAPLHIRYKFEVHYMML